MKKSVFYFALFFIFLAQVWGVDTFDCVESGENRLYMKISGVPFGFYVVALKADGTIEDSYDKTVTVDMVEDSGGACGGAVIASQTLLFKAVDNGKKAIASTVINSAHKKLRCRVTDQTDLNNTVVGCSSDTFAVRPASFSGAINGFLAGEQKSAAPANTIVAKAGNNTPNVFGYNAILDKSSIVGVTFDPIGSICESDTTEKLIDNITVSFTDGVSSSIDAKFKDIGVFDLNLTDSVWTLGDECIIGSSSNTLFGGKYGCDIQGSVKVSVGVYQMGVESNSNATKWKYKASSLADQNASYTGVVRAEGKDGSLLKNFSKSCFGENTNIAFRYSANGAVDIFHKAYAAGALIDDKNSSSSPVGFVIPKSGFGALDANGSAGFNIDFGAHRDFGVATNPTKFVPLEINTTNSAPTQLGYKFDSNATTYFLYGKISMPDTMMDYNGATQTVRAFAQIYDGTNARDFVKDNNLTLALGSDKWWVNALDTSSIISNILIKSSNKLNNTADPVGFSTSNAISKGKFDINITMSSAPNKDQKLKLHLDIPKYLWYSIGVDDYSFASNSTCSAHPCASVDIFGSNASTWLGNSDKTIKSLPKGKRNMKINW